MPIYFGNIFCISVRCRKDKDHFYRRPFIYPLYWAFAPIQQLAKCWLLWFEHIAQSPHRLDMARVTRDFFNQAPKFEDGYRRRGPGFFVVLFSTYEAHQRIPESTTRRCAKNAMLET
jgi:hypothetical protein